jgi:ketosteroid isomerase-like protein
MTAQENAQLLLDVFSAIESRNDRRFRDLLAPDFELHWPQSLPYGGITRGPSPSVPTWSETWTPLQPTEIERRMDPRVVAAGEDEVVVLWHQRGVTSAGVRFDGEVLGLYQVRGGKLARAQMFYFDTVPLVDFLMSAKGHAAMPES